MDEKLKEIETELNNHVNLLQIINDNDKGVVNSQIIYHITKYLQNCHNQGKIYNWKVNCDYPEVEVIIQQRRAMDFNIIILNRFERIKKLLKIQEISNHD